MLTQVRRAQDLGMYPGQPKIPPWAGIADRSQYAPECVFIQVRRGCSSFCPSKTIFCKVLTTHSED